MAEPIPAAASPAAPVEQPLNYAAELAAQGGAQTTTETQAAPVVAPSWSDSFKEAGFNTEGYDDPKAFAAALSEYHRDLAQKAAYAQQLQSVAPEFQEWMESRNKAKEPEKQEDGEWTLDGHFAKAWERPKHDPQWDQMVQMGWIAFEDGQYVAKAPHTPPQAIHGLNQERLWQREALNRLLENPHKLIYEGLKEPLMREVQAAIQQSLGGYQQQQAMTAWEQQNAHLLYQLDQNGNILRDQTGNYQQTLMGNRFYQYMAHYKGKLPEAERQQVAFERASSDAIIAAHQADLAEAAKKAAPAGNGKAAANGNPNLPTPATATKESFLQTAIERAAHSPTAGNPGKQLDDLGTYQHKSDTKGMFVNAARAAGLPM